MCINFLIKIPGGKEFVSFPTLHLIFRTIKEWYEKNINKILKNELHVELTKPTLIFTNFKHCKSYAVIVKIR